MSGCGMRVWGYMIDVYIMQMFPEPWGILQRFCPRLLLISLNWQKECFSRVVFSPGTKLLFLRC